MSDDTNASMHQSHSTALGGTTGITWRTNSAKSSFGSISSSRYYVNSCVSRKEERVGRGGDHGLILLSFGCYLFFQSIGTLQVGCKWRRYCYIQSKRHQVHTPSSLPRRCQCLGGTTVALVNSMDISCRLGTAGAERGRIPPCRVPGGNTIVSPASTSNVSSSQKPIPDPERIKKTS